MAQASGWQDDEDPWQGSLGATWLKAGRLPRPQLRSDDDQLFELSEDAAQLCVTLRHMLENGSAEPVTVPLGSDSLARVAALLERAVTLVEGAPADSQANLSENGLKRGEKLADELLAATEAALDQLGITGLLDAAVRLREMHWFSAPLPTTLLAERMARLLRGQPAAALRELLGVADGDHLSADAMSAVLAEPLCAPSAAPFPTVDDPEGDMMMACLERCDARTLRELKAVSAAWQRRARAVLCDAASAWRQQPIWSPCAEGAALAARLGGGSAGERRTALERMCTRLDHGVDLPGHAWAVVPLLEDSERIVRSTAVQTLGHIEPAVLALYGAALVAKLVDSDEWVRYYAVETLGKLDGAFALQGAALVARLEDSSFMVRRAALGKIEVAALAPHGAAVAARLWDSNGGVRKAAVQTLGKLDVAALVQHAAALTTRLEDDVGEVQIAARLVMHKLEPGAGHMDAIAAKLEDDDADVRIAAVETLGTFEVAALAQHQQAIAKAAEEYTGGEDWRDQLMVQIAARVVMHKLEPGAGHISAIAAMFEVSSWEVRQAAVWTLGELDVAVLAQHEQVVAELTLTAEGDEDENVRDAANTVLAKLRAGK